MLRTARQRTRATREDKCKQYRRLYNELDTLKRARADLPMTKLEEPYQRGWKRHFMVRPDVAISADGPFYKSLLAKLNQVQYWHDETFMRKVRGSKKKIYTHTAPELKVYEECVWRHTKELNEKERLCFHREYLPCRHGDWYYWGYVFSEPWRYTIAVEPNIITEVQLLDSELEQEIARLDDFLNEANVMKVMRRYVHGRGKYPGVRQRRPEENPIKNKPLHVIVEQNEDSTK